MARRLDSVRKNDLDVEEKGFEAEAETANFFVILGVHAR
jgi:hypothetical protein